MRLDPRIDKPNHPLALELIQADNALGIYVDDEKLSVRVSQLILRRDKLIKELRQEAGSGFNPNYYLDVQEFLINKLHVPEEELYYNNKISTRAEVLEKLKDRFPFAQNMIEYRRANNKINNLGDFAEGSEGKVKSGKSILASAKPTNVKNAQGRPLTSFVPKITLVNTSRYQYAEPNIGGLNSEIADVLCAPEGYYMVWIDVKQQEPSILYEGVLNCKPIKKIFKETDGDRYLAIAKFCIMQTELKNKIRSYLKDKDLKDIYKDDWTYPYLIKNLKDDKVHINRYRKNADTELEMGRHYTVDYKALNKAISEMPHEDIVVDKTTRDLYKVAILSGGFGATRGSLIEQVGRGVGNSLYNMLDTLPELNAYKAAAKRYLEAGGRTIHTGFKTKLVIPKTNAKGKISSISAMIRRTINYPTQGTGADMLKMGIIQVDKWKKDNNYTAKDVRYAFTKHDEHVFYVKKELEGVIDDLENIISIEIDGWAPISVESAYGDSYGIAIEGDWGRR